MVRPTYIRIIFRCQHPVSLTRLAKCHQKLVIPIYSATGIPQQSSGNRNTASFGLSQTLCCAESQYAGTK
jgi:hypothetical protein